VRVLGAGCERFGYFGALRGHCWQSRAWRAERARPIERARHQQARSVWPHSAPGVPRLPPCRTCRGDGARARPARALEPLNGPFPATSHARQGRVCSRASEPVDGLHLRRSRSPRSPVGTADGAQVSSLAEVHVVSPTRRPGRQKRCGLSSAPPWVTRRRPRYWRVDWNSLAERGRFRSLSDVQSRKGLNTVRGKEMARPMPVPRRGDPVRAGRTRRQTCPRCWTWRTRQRCRRRNLHREMNMAGPLVIVRIPTEPART